MYDNNIFYASREYISQTKVAMTTMDENQNYDDSTSSNNDFQNANPNIDDDEPVARAAARGTIVTLTLRFVSFACTQWTFRMLDPATLGKANIQLELLLTSVLFISTEGFRLALTRNISLDNWNVAWLTIPVVTIVAGGALTWHAYHYFYSIKTSTTTTTTDDDDDIDYRIAGILYSLACWIGGCAEPAVLYCLRRMDVPTKVSAEGLGLVAKSISTVVTLQHHRLVNYPLTAFGISQMVYALVYSGYLYGKTYSKLIHPTLSFDVPTCYLTLVFTLQGFFKHLLTEADRIVLTTVSDSYDQGVYAMGSAYGGMAARILLQPIEENCRLLWSRLAFKDIKVNTDESRQQNKTLLDPLEQSYTVLLKVVLYIGLVFSCVAVNYTSLLLNIMAGRKWGKNVEAAEVLSAFCVYTAFLACNGTTEAFVYGVTTSGKQIGRLGMAHTVIGIAFAIVAPKLVELHGTVGLVSANCVAMTLRSFYSFFFAVQYFGQRWKRQQPNLQQQLPASTILRRLLRQIIPHPVVLTSFAITWAITKWSWMRLSSYGFYEEFHIGNTDWLLRSGEHLSIGISCMVGTAGLVYFLEVEMRHSLMSMLKSKQE